MNKLRILLPGFVLAMGLSVPSGAEQVQGFVESVDSSNHSILIKDLVSGSGKSVRVHPKVISEIKKGSVVKANLQTGSDQADTVQILVGH